MKGRIIVNRRIIRQGKQNLIPIFIPTRKKGRADIQLKTFKTALVGRYDWASKVAEEIQRERARNFERSSFQNEAT